MDANATWFSALWFCITANVAVSQIMMPPRVSSLMVSQRFELMLTRVNLMLLSMDFPLIEAILSYALYARIEDNPFNASPNCAYTGDLVIESRRFTSLDVLCSSNKTYRRSSARERERER